MFNEKTGRRARRQEVVELHEARKFIRPYQTDLAHWNGQFARLRAQDRMRPATDSKAQAANIARQISQIRSQLHADLRQVDDGVGQHSVVRDLDRAMLRLASELEGLAQGTPTPTEV